MSFKQTSFNYLTAGPEHLGPNLDRDLKVAFSQMQTADSTAIKGPVFGGSFAMAAGVASVVNGTVTVATGLSKVQHVVATPDAGGGVALALWVSAQPSKNSATPGSVDILLWTPTSSSVTTPIAASGTFVVHWIATGTAVTTT